MASCSTGSVSSPPEGPIVPLSFRPIQIVSANGALWIAGTDESIATSQDGGATWELKHSVKDGEVLVDIGWLNAKSGYAAGTRGIFLWTADGGKTWTPRTGATGTTWQVSFGDENHGIRKTDSTAEFTTDGGAHWNEIPALKSDKPVEGEQTIHDVVALDSNRMAVSLERGTYTEHDNMLVAATTDGAKRWMTVEMPLMRFTLVATDGEYWAAGRKNIGNIVAKDSGGKPIELPLVSHSRDGENWTDRPKIPVDLGPCNIQGCLLWDGAWADPVSGMPPYFIFPARSTWGSMTYKWAAAAGRMCTLEADLVCTDSTISTSIPPKSKPTSRVTIEIEGNPFEGQQSLGKRCLSCPGPVVLDPNWPDLSGGSSALVKFVVRKNGTVGDVQMGAVPGAGFAVDKNGTVDQIAVNKWFRSKYDAPLTRAVQKWVFEPILDKNGSAVDQEEHGRIDFIVVHPPENK